MLQRLVRFWLGPLPIEELFPQTKPNFFLHWFIHPLKRRLAKWYLWILKSIFGLKVIALTGSAGKTTTKQLLHAAFSFIGPTVSTADSTTSTYNIPTTILKATPQTRYLILEMGVEYPGDMDFYTWLARPDVAIVLNVDRTHTHFLGSVENVAFEKTKIFAALPPTGIAVLPINNPLITPPINAKSLTFGTNSPAFCQIITSKLKSDFSTQVNLIINQQPVSITLPLIGEHLASNLAATLAAAYALGIDPASLAQAFKTVLTPLHRLQPIQLKNGAYLIDDTYNANPFATAQSLATLITLSRLLKKTPVLVFGQMNELGQYEQSAHAEIGRLIKKYKLKHVFYHGPATKHTQKSAAVGQYFDSPTALTSYLKKFIQPSHLVLVKASRGLHFENIIAALTD